MNKQKILSTPVTKWTLEEIKAIAEQMRKTDPDLIAARANKAANSNKKKSQSLGLYFFLTSTPFNMHFNYFF